MKIKLSWRDGKIQTVNVARHASDSQKARAGSDICPPKIDRDSRDRDLRRAGAFGADSKTSAPQGTAPTHILSWVFRQRTHPGETRKI